MDQDAIRAERTLLENALENFSEVTEKLETEAEFNAAISLADAASYRLKSLRTMLYD